MVWLDLEGMLNFSSSVFPHLLSSSFKLLLFDIVLFGVCNGVSFPRGMDEFEILLILGSRPFSFGHQREGRG